ncbi:MAG: ankyrin repeat domain-containing protein [Gemmatimonadota bacterium]|nr:ankyrin repeat domain-containing protein [Gemmatimonadota bacterium]
MIGAACAAALLMGATLLSGTPLVDAARRGEVELVRSMLDDGADVNAAQGDGLTALHASAERGHVEIAKLLIAAGADLDAETRIGHYTPLHLAGRGGHGHVVLALAEAGADVSRATSNTGVTPLHLAASAVGGERAVATLLDHGAAVNAREASAGQTPLMFAAAYDRAAAVRELLSRGADPAITTTVVDVLRSVAIDREANGRFRRMVRSLRDSAGGAADWDPSPAQVQAAIRAQREFLLSDDPGGEVDATDLVNYRPDYPGGPDVARPPYRETLVGKTGGMTALLHAAREGHVESARVLLEGGADVDQMSVGDRTSPLLMAALNGQFDVALLFVEQGADPDLAASTDGASPLFAVLQTQWAPQSNYPQPRAHDRQEAEHLDVLRALVEAGADPNVRLNTHLWYWEYGLTKLGIDLQGATPFWRATFAQDLEAMKLLAGYGADPNIPTSWPAVGMRERRQQDGRQQEDSGLPSLPEGMPSAYPVHIAAGGGWLGLGAFSVRSVPDQFMSVLRYLIDEHGADVDLRDSWGYTPLHYAASRGDNEMIRYLVTQGADVSAITRLGQSTADMARGGRAGFFTRVAYPETVALLQGLGSTLECLHTHFLDTGDFCPGAGVTWGAKSGR